MARRKITGRQLARDLKWSRTHTSRRLNGEYAFRIDQLVEIAGYLGCPLTDLLPVDRAAA